MPKYRFSWDAFDDATVEALADAIGYSPSHTGKSRRDWLADKVKRPNPEFVKRTKVVLQDTWFRNYPGVREIVNELRDRFIGPMNIPRSQKGYLEYIRKCRNENSIQTLLAEAMIRYGDMDRDSEAEPRPSDYVPRFAVLAVADQPKDPRKPHPYQQEARDKLSKHCAEAETTGVFQGLLVMPTGSGKTFTTVGWLVDRILNQGGRILWVAHRHELLEQAAREFHVLAGSFTAGEQLRVRIVSGKHCTTSQIDPADHIVVSSIFSLARNSERIQESLKDPNLFLVIDEAHHAPARSYRDIIRVLNAAASRRILGLTATPTRTVEEERPILGRLFARNTIHEVPLNTLIEQSYLARPRPIRVRTDTDVEEGVTADDLKHLTRFDDLSEPWLDRIAKMTVRNDVIVNHFMEKKDKYGKTLIFAINVPHATLLADRLRENGVNAQYVASYRPDGSPGSNSKIVAEFRDGEIEVLTNVMIMTEGVDVPSIETVFLTRPTNSEILLRQMIGRALRGPKVGGTELAYLVSFEDHWERFRDWQSPLDLAPDLADFAEEVEERPPQRQQVLEQLPWELIYEAANALRRISPDRPAEVFEAIPHGWYVLEREEEDQGYRKTLAVYEHQRPCWEELMDHLEQLSREQLEAVEPEHAFDYAFSDCDIPKPSDYEVEEVVRHFQMGGERPEYSAWLERDRCDPSGVATAIWQQDLGERARIALIDQSYSSLAQAIYPNPREYHDAVNDALFGLSHPGEAPSQPRGYPVFHPGPDEHLAPGPAHDLDTLYAETAKAAAQLLEVPSVPFKGELRWSKRLIKGWYGKANFSSDTPTGYGDITINVLLDSPDIAASTIRFLLWHEYLHLYLKQGHTSTFRELERRWSGWVEADRQLDTLNDRFGIQYW